MPTRAPVSLEIPERDPAQKSALRRKSPPLRMVFGGNDPDPKKITREDEPEEYFASDFESASVEEKLKDPLVIIGSSAPRLLPSLSSFFSRRSPFPPRRIASIFFPFVLLAIFNAGGLVG